MNPNTLKPGQVEETTRTVRQQKVISTNRPPFVMAGVGNGKGKNILMLDYATGLSKGALRLFKKMVDTRDVFSNHSTLTEPESESERIMRTKLLRELVKSGGIRKIKVDQLVHPKGLSYQVPKRTYFINPDLIFPRSKNQTEDGYTMALFYWEQLA